MLIEFARIRVSGLKDSRKPGGAGHVKTGRCFVAGVASDAALFQKRLNRAVEVLRVSEIGEGDPTGAELHVDIIYLLEDFWPMVPLSGRS